MDGKGVSEPFVFPYGLCYTREMGERIPMTI